MQKGDELKIPDITRLYKGPQNEFEVEIVFAEEGGVSPKESHPFLELIIVTDGSITLKRSDKEEDLNYSSSVLIEVPAGVEHVIKNDIPTKLVIIHPRRI